MKFVDGFKKFVASFNHWLLDVKVETSVPSSRLSKSLEKIPLLLVMYGSSCLVGISTYASFPYPNEFLRLSSALAVGVAFDLILASTVFSKRKNKFSILTILAALVTGVLISLDLYMGWHQLWLHATYMGLGTLYSLHAATTRLDVELASSIKSRAAARKSSGMSSSTSSLQPSAVYPRVDTYPEPVAVDASSTSSLDTSSASTWLCPTCSSALASKQAYGSAKRLGYCRQCKS